MNVSSWNRGVKLKLFRRVQSSTGRHSRDYKLLHSFFFFSARTSESATSKESVGRCRAMIGASAPSLTFGRLITAWKTIYTGYVALQITLFARTIDLRLRFARFLNFVD